MTDRCRKQYQRRPGVLAGHDPSESPVTFDRNQRSSSAEYATIQVMKSKVSGEKQPTVGVVNFELIGRGVRFTYSDKSSLVHGRPDRLGTNVLANRME